MSRQGLNCTLSYTGPKKQRRAYRVRASVLTHGMKVLYDESQARVRRAFYPHRLTSAQFAVQVDLVGEDEYISFTTWLARYADFILDPDLRLGEFPSMAVSIPSQNFLRKGVPLTGYEWGDAVGKMLWSLPLTFETAGEPGDKAVTLSQPGGLALLDKDARYFYPSGVQLSGNGTPPDGSYAQAITLADVTAIMDEGEAYDSTGTQRRQGGLTK